ncbi:MAG: glycoside hydrolase family 38 N-terminal domain-containing protein, partial [Planctomycetota bacterium]
MSLTTEWRRRLDRWRKELPRHFHRPLGTLELEGFVTNEQLPPEQAARGDFRPMPAGTRWGAKWEYGWFRCEVVLPKEAAGRRVVLELGLGGEALVYVNGDAASGRGRVERSKEGVAGERYEVLAECYAGHGPLACAAGPTPPGRQTVPEPGPTQAEVRESSLSIWEEDVYQLGMDVETLAKLREAIADDDSLRVQQIDAGLREFTTLVDFELPRDEMVKTARAARGRLAPLLECANGTTAPVMHAFGHAHLDVAWLWPLAETERKVARTLANQLDLIDQYPGYRFMHSQPHLFRMAARRHRRLYERVKRAVETGGIIADGAMWVEADTNVTGGESLIRQFVHGKRFFREEFGIQSRVMWLPDVFGYSGAMPQIMRGCGVDYFASQKIFWTYAGGEPFPYNAFIWEGIDGSEVLAHLFTDYNSHLDPASVVRRWKELVQKDGVTSRILAFGHGDGGGGPTRDHLEYMRREADLEGVPRVRPSSPLEFFTELARDIESRDRELPRYVGELYYQAHRGTYTSQAKTKLGNRKSELALREAEMWGAAAGALAESV